MCFSFNDKLPFLTSDMPPLPATIKMRYEDFVVEEIPAYEPSGQGSHVYFGLEKKGLSTARAVRDLAKALGLKPRDIGVAGMKDSRAVTRQMMSVENIDPAKLENLILPRISILWTSRHRNKLRTGHHRGNRFAIRLRDTDTTREDDVRAVLSYLSTHGVPNYFGSQRFGLRGDTWQVGRALLLGDFELVARIIAGSPDPSRDTGDVLRARELFDAGEFSEAAVAWPRGFEECVNLCRAMSRFKNDAKRAVLSLDKRTLSFYVSAFQSQLFNESVALHIKKLDQIEDGDLAWKHENGAVFLVEDAAREAPRAMRFEISATGPMFGHKMTLPTGEPLLQEIALLKNAGVTTEVFSQASSFRPRGGRRPIRFQPENVSCQAGQDEHGPFLELAFVLPPGCYATTLLREICKEQLRQREI